MNDFTVFTAVLSLLIAIQISNRWRHLKCIEVVMPMLETTCPINWQLLRRGNFTCPVRAGKIET